MDLQDQRILLLGIKPRRFENPALNLPAVVPGFEPELLKLSQRPMFQKACVQIGQAKKPGARAADNGHIGWSLRVGESESNGAVVCLREGAAGIRPVQCRPADTTGQ